MSKLLTVREAATLLRVSEFTVRRWISSGHLPAVRPGRFYLIKSESVARLTDSATDVVDEYVKHICARAPELTPEDIEALRRIVGAASDR